MKTNILDYPHHVARIREAAASVVESAAHACGLQYDDIMKPGRKANIVEARHAAMLVLYRAGWSYPSIAGAVGLTDHTTAVHGVRKASKKAKVDPGFAAAVAFASKAVPPPIITRAVF